MSVKPPKIPKPPKPPNLAMAPSAEGDGGRSPMFAGFRGMQGGPLRALMARSRGGRRSLIGG